MKVLYFGVWESGGAGHYLHDQGGYKSYRGEAELPFRETILDAGLLPQKGDQVEGLIYSNNINGWTILSFWDRSGDSRSASNSSFLFHTGTGMYGLADLLGVAKEQFPSVFSRFGFDLKLA